MTGDVKLEDDPIGEVFQWLKDDNYKCIDVRTVSWQTNGGSASGRQFGKKRYLIECRGDCRGSATRRFGMALIGSSTTECQRGSQ